MINPRKILAPILPPTLFHREQLLQILGEAAGANTVASNPGAYYLVLLCAPAGYGKTTLLADTARRFSLTCCWYFLDRSDQDIPTFLKTLLASIRQHFPDVGLHLDARLVENIDQDEKAFQALLDELFHALTHIGEHWILALCNYQEVNSCPAINRLINAFLKRLSPECLLIIESRALPDLELAALVAGQKMFGLGSHDLQFSSQEVYAFAQAKRVPDFSLDEAEQTTTVFDGWIAGMLLGSRLGPTHQPRFLPSHSDLQGIVAQPADRRQLLAFVVSEVFRNEKEVYTFLKETSLLDQLIPTFCNAFCKTSNAAQLLEYAERQGLFVTCSHENGELIYRCHPLLRELFQEELRRYEEEWYRALQRQLAILFYQIHLYETALKHALEAQDYTLIAQTLLEVTSKLLNQGQSDLVLHCLNFLPEHIVLSNPRLLLIQVNTYLRRGDFASAQSSFEQAEYLVASLESIEYELFYAELAITKGELFLQQGEHQQALKYFQHALVQLPVDERILRIRARQQLGICMILSGQPIYEGIAQFQQALGLCHPRLDERLAGELHHQLANAYGWAGNYAVAEHHRQRIRVLQERLGQPHFLINNLTSMGLLKMRQGYGEEAETFFQTMLTLANQSPRLMSSKAYALLGLGELEWTRQHFPEALMHLEEASLLARQLEDRYLRNNILNMQALVYLRLDDIYTAQYLQEQTSLQTNENRSYESVFSTLVQGTLRLAQKNYEAARCLFEEVIHLTGETGIQWLQVQALMRLAACCLAQANRVQARNVLQQAVALNTKGDHDCTLQVEIQAYPALQPLLEEKGETGTVVEIQQGATERLRISALGEPTVLIDALPVTRWRMARAMELYFFLLERHQPLRKDQIIDALWPEPEDIERVNQTFRSTLYYLRQVMGEASLVQQSGLYRLDLHANYGPFWYDVAIFEEQRCIARTALEANDDQSATQAFQQMVDLYQGDYVQAFYSDWCISRRDELRTSFMEAHHQLAMLAWRNEAWEKSLLHWQHLLTLDPCMEAAHYGVMRSYLRQGKRNLALRQYQRCCKELREQLGIEPGSALQKLYLRLTSN
jgi:LuxR family transcriptional regulator, maltose regulon positive regulatory protein